MHEYRRILALIAFEKSDVAVLRRALGLSQLSGAELTLLHLIPLDAELDGGYPSATLAETRHAYEAAAERRLRFLAASQGVEAVGTVARYGTKGACFSGFANEWRPDLVIVAEDPGYIHGRHDVLTLGRKPKHGGRLIALLGGLFLPLQAGAERG